MLSANKSRLVGKRWCYLLLLYHGGSEHTAVADLPKAKAEDNAAAFWCFKARPTYAKHRDYYIASNLKEALAVLSQLGLVWVLL